MNNKRFRSLNWEEDEKRLFCSIIKDYVDVIENKSLDTNTNKTKNKAWEEVHKKFNELNKRTRDLHQIKIHWKKMKIDRKKKYSMFTKEINYNNGGGTGAAAPSNEIIRDLITDSNMYDSDGIDDYSTNMTMHSRMLKDEEQRRRMEMAEEEHAIKIKILHEQLKSAILERELLELKREKILLLKQDI